MAQLVLSRGTHYQRNLLKKFFAKFELGPVFLLSSLVMFVALITVITLMFSARQVTKGYVLNSLEAQNDELVKESESMQMQISLVRSLKSIQQTPKVKRMIKPQASVFIHQESAIASR